jgi:hypothetical protein
MIQINIFRSLVTIILIAIIYGCSSGTKSSSEISTSSSHQTTIVNQENIPSNVADKEKIKFKTEGGSDLFSLKQGVDGIKLVDANNKELARIKTDKPGTLKIKDASEKVLGYLVTKGDWKLQNSDGNKNLYILKRQGDGDYKLKDTLDKEIYQIKKRENGLEIVTPDKKLVYKVKVKDDKISLRDASGKTIFSTKSKLSPIAFACFGFDVLTREQQTALAYAVNLTGGQ